MPRHWEYRAVQTDAGYWHLWRAAGRAKRWEWLGPVEVVPLSTCKCDDAGCPKCGAISCYADASRVRLEEIDCQDRDQ